MQAFVSCSVLVILKMERSNNNAAVENVEGYFCSFGIRDPDPEDQRGCNF